MEKFDFVICTFNSEHSIKECLSSILDNFKNLNKIFIIDGGSKDDTLNIIESLGDKRIIVKIKPDLNLGESRSYAFELPETEYFIQIDSDIVLYPSFEKIFLDTYKQADVVEYGVKNWYSFETPTIEDFESGKHNRRAFFFLNSMKKEKVTGYKLPVKNMEEELLRVLIQKKGGSWIKTNTILGDHYSKPVRYENRQITTIVRIKPLPSFVFEDLGFIDKIKKNSIKSVFRSLLYVFYLSLNLGLLKLWFQSLSLFPVTFFHYFKGYKKKIE
jgi:glycosyltransferase involved in cell wall biosynthesis